MNGFVGSALVTCVVCLFTGAHTRTHTLTHDMCNMLLLAERKMKKWESSALFLFLSGGRVCECVCAYVLQIVSKVLVWSLYSPYVPHNRSRREKEKTKIKKRVSASLRISFTSIYIWCLCERPCVYTCWMHAVQCSNGLSLSHTIKSLIRFGVVWIVYDSEVQFIQSHSTDTKCLLVC